MLALIFGVIKFRDYLLCRSFNLEPVHRQQNMAEDVFQLTIGQPKESFYHV